MSLDTQWSQPYSEKNIIIVDYKTTADCSPKGFVSSVRKYGYDLQASWYKRGMKKRDLKVEGFYFVAQEKRNLMLVKSSKCLKRLSSWVDSVRRHFRAI